MIRFFIGIGVFIAWSVLIGVIAPRIPAAWFVRDRCRVTAGECRVWEAFGVRWWKRYLPDAGGWFSKDGRKDGNIRNSQAALQRFVVETRRAELVHWCSLAIVPTFFLWCPLPAALFLLAAGLVANGPCLIALRYNRRRVVEVLDRRRPGIAEHDR